MMKFLVGSCEQRPMLRDGTVLRSSAVTIGTNVNKVEGVKFGTQCYCMQGKFWPPNHTF